MTGLSGIAGTQGMTGIVPLPSEELERLPPASPLVRTDETDVSSAQEGKDAVVTTRMAPQRDTQEPAPSEEDQPTEPQAVRGEPGRPESRGEEEPGAYLDVLG